MIDRVSQRGKRKRLLLNRGAGLLLVLLGFIFSACNSEASANCSGLGVSCQSGGPNPAALIATADAITHHKPLLTDPLSQKDGNGWYEDANCFFQNGAYILALDSSTSISTLFCDSPKLLYGNAAIQIDVTLISGDTAGLLFRKDQSNTFYDFEITKYGQFDLAIDGDNIKHLIPATTSSAIHPEGKKNTLLVIAKGNNFQLFINGTFVGETQDNTVSGGGKIGVTTADYTGPAWASFSDLIVYAV